LGPNGAGKTTTLRLLLGLASPTSGKTLVFGRPYPKLDDPARRVGALLESGDFDPGRNGRNHLRMLAMAIGATADRVDELLDLVELGRAARRPVDILTHTMSVASWEPQVATLVALGVGVDYALFIVRRHRSALLAGRTPEEAAITALNTSGRAVLL
jgi:hypothetical protein